ncbi:tetratricopeptide repeat protein [Streptomyces sp. NBRC 109706]|uniref:tetratricopeptide repeat protein n=1 Tax=Streptomyces sp. NBRC 109706 TaxID=1550035 RepID=UPI000A7AB9E3|nr:tetratricopeptide repeat protein [Streptomyces sp. NBRC 109706]
MTDVTEQTVTDGGGFLGRRRELATLRADIERAGLDTLAGRPAPRGRVLLVAGRPGSGRSALAERLAAELAGSGDYPDGVCHARLTDPGGVPVPTARTARELLARLGVPAPAGGDDAELSDLLREALADRRAVLLLDDVATADQLAELVPDNRDCLVLAVAGGPLTGVPDVRPCVLGGLERPLSVRLLARGGGPVRGTVDPGAADSLAELCADLPAALVLAAGWLTLHPEHTIADAVCGIAAGADHLPLHDSGPADPADLPLHRAFGLVYAALPTPAARMLRLLTLAPGGLVDAHVAAALAGCPTGLAETLLTDFAAFGLLRPLAEPPVAGVGPQYRVPGCLDPLLGALLRAQERPGDALLARARTLERTVRLLRACHATTEPSGSPARQWLSGLPRSLRFESPGAAGRWLTARLPALFAAARVAVSDGELDTLARRLIAALTRALIAHRGPDEAAPELYQLHELVLGVATRLGLTREKAAALLNLGDLDARTGRLPQALTRYRAALEEARAEGDAADPLAVGRTLESIGGTYAELSDWQRAADWYGRAVALAQARDDLAGEARLHGRIGAVLAYDGQLDESLRAWRAAASAHRRRGDVQAHARSLTEAARIQEYAGQYEESERTGKEALRLAAGTGDRRLQAALRLRLADAAERLGHAERAAVHRAVAQTLLNEPVPVLERPGPAVESSVSPEGHTYETQMKHGDD